MIIEWEIHDGFVTGRRVRQIEIPDEDLLDCGNEAELNELIDESVYHDFETRVSFSILNRPSFADVQKRQEN